eukprot:766247-Hanusia_phi.AAC.1
MQWTQMRGQDITCGKCQQEIAEGAGSDARWRGPLIGEDEREGGRGEWEERRGKGRGFMRRRDRERDCEGRRHAAMQAPIDNVSGRHQRGARATRGVGLEQPRSTMPSPALEVGRKVKALFDETDWYVGHIQDYDKESELYTIIFEDGEQISTTIPSPDDDVRIVLTEEEAESLYKWFPGVAKKALMEIVDKMPPKSAARQGLLECLSSKSNEVIESMRCGTKEEFFHTISQELRQALLNQKPPMAEADIESFVAELEKAIMSANFIKKAANASKQMKLVLSFKQKTVTEVPQPDSPQTATNSVAQEGPSSATSTPTQAAGVAGRKGEPCEAYAEGEWWLAKIIRCKQGKALVRFEGAGKEEDCWYDLSGKYIRPRQGDEDYVVQAELEDEEAYTPAKETAKSEANSKPSKTQPEQSAEDDGNEVAWQPGDRCRVWDGGEWEEGTVVKVRNKTVLVRKDSSQSEVWYVKNSNTIQPLQAQTPSSKQSASKQSAEESAPSKAKGGQRKSKGATPAKTEEEAEEAAASKEKEQEELDAFDAGLKQPDNGSQDALAKGDLCEAYAEGEWWLAKIIRCKQGQALVRFEGAGKEEDC